MKRWKTHERKGRPSGPPIRNWTRDALKGSIAAAGLEVDDRARHVVGAVARIARDANRVVGAAPARLVAQRVARGFVARLEIGRHRAGDAGDESGRGEEDDERLHGKSPFDLSATEIRPHP